MWATGANRHQRSCRSGLFVGAVIVAGVLAMPGLALAIPAPTTFSYTGAEQSYMVPSGVVMVAMATVGGHGGQFAEGGGREGGVGALWPSMPGQTLFAEVGGAGAYNGGAVFGGGGAAGAPPPVIAMCTTGGPSFPCADVYASSGGGASDVRTCSMSAASCPGGASSAATRLIVGGGGGGESGGGNAPAQTCVGNGATGNANNFQYPPGNPAGGHPVPIITAAGIVYPADYLPDTTGQSGITPAGNGSDVAGFGGSQAGCTSGGGSVLISDSIAGSSAVGPAGGAGGNASTLGPMDPSCSGQGCDDAGPGGGGGGGYFGGGGGATGLDKVSGNCGACNGAGAGQPGGAGSGFTSNQTMDPMDMSNLLGSGNGEVVIVPAIEIDAPANGAVYTPGQVVTASWSCGYDTTIGMGVSGCTASVADGSAIDTTPGTHSFTVTGGATSNGNHTVTATVTYTVGVTRISVPAGKVDSTHRTATFTFTATAPATRFQCALIKRKKNGKYPPPSFSACVSPRIYKNLKPGTYKFEARSVAGTSHGTPVIKSFRIT